MPCLFGEKKWIGLVIRDPPYRYWYICLRRWRWAVGWSKRWIHLSTPFALIYLTYSCFVGVSGRVLVACVAEGAGVGLVRAWHVNKKHSGFGMAERRVFAKASLTTRSLPNTDGYGHLSEPRLATAGSLRFRNRKISFCVCEVQYLI